MKCHISDLVRHFVTEQNEENEQHFHINRVTLYMTRKKSTCTALDTDHKEKAGSRHCTWHYFLHLRDL